MEAYKRSLYPTWGKSPVKGFINVREYVISLAVVSGLRVEKGVVVAGDWHCMYTGMIYRIQDVTPDMEHIWAAKYIHDNGGAQATKSQRRAIANDPLNLVAVHPSSNRKKSNKVASWLPINGGCWPWYLERLHLVKDKYTWLTVSDSALKRFVKVKDKSHEVRNGFFIEKQKNLLMRLWSR